MGLAERRGGSMRILYQRLRITEDNYGSYDREADACMFTKPDALARQLLEVFRIPDHEEWNGYEEMRVEEEYAEAWMWHEMFASPKYDSIRQSTPSRIAKAYGIPFGWWDIIGVTIENKGKDNYDELSSMARELRRWDNNKCDSFADPITCEYDAWEYTEERIEMCKLARKVMPYCKAYWEKIKQTMSEIMPKFYHNQLLKFSDQYGWDVTVIHTFDAVHAREVSISKPMNETLYEREHREGMEYYYSEAGQAEMKEHEERHQEMMTYMGESGLNSYSVDADGRYTMWRD